MEALVTGLGDPNAVESAVDELRRASQSAESAHSLARRAEPELWRGKAAEAFSDSARATLPKSQHLADALLSASGTLSRYAAVQRASAANYEAAQTKFDRAAESLRRNPLDIPAALHLVQARMSAFAEIGRLQEAASIAATELQSAIDGDEDGKPWWDPFGWFSDPEDPDERVTEDIMDDDAFDPDDVAQGSIGDCFMLSSVVSLLNTDEGDEFIRENIRWDSDKEGFWVTIYPNGEPKEVFVEHVFDNGARQDDWEWLFLSGDKPSIAALYESALRQEYGYNFLDGGKPYVAMEIITGKPVHVIENDRYRGLSDGQMNNVRKAIEEGGQAVISSPRDGHHEITVTGPDGSTREVEIVTSHSYSVMKVEPDGSVWVRNPWGPGNSADGGGAFLVSEEDAGRLFWRATMTNVTE